MAQSFCLPAKLLWAAAQFASTDDAKGVITTIRVRPIDGGGIIIDSTDGNRAFRVACRHEQWHCSETLLLDPKKFKKWIAAAFAAQSETGMDGIAKITDINGIPCAGIPYSTPWEADGWPNLDQLWPFECGNNPKKPIHFNANLLADYLKVVGKLSGKGCTKMETNGALQPLRFLAEVADGTKATRKVPLSDKLEEVPATVSLEFMLMPLQVRE